MNDILFSLKTKLWFFLFLCSFVPAWAGTEITGRLESVVYKQVWVDLDVLISDGHVRINFTGPFAKGVLIFDKKTSGLILVDGFEKCVVPITQTDQEAVRLMGILGSGSIKSAVDNSQASVRMAYKLVANNACALLNGKPVLKEKGARVNGFTSDLYKTVVSDKAARKVWMVTPKESTLDQDDYVTLMSLKDLAFDMGGAILKELGVTGNAYVQRDSLPQLPVLIALYVDGKESSRFMVHKIHPKILTVEAFDQPTGYKTVGFLGLIKQGM